MATETSASTSDYAQVEEHMFVSDPEQQPKGGLAPNLLRFLHIAKNVLFLIGFLAAWLLLSAFIATFAVAYTRTLLSTDTNPSLLLDTDGDTDDLVALAAVLPNVRAITTCNAGLSPNATDNILRVLEHLSATSAAISLPLIDAGEHETSTLHGIPELHGTAKLNGASESQSTSTLRGSSTLHGTSTLRGSSTLRGASEVRGTHGGRERMSASYLALQGSLVRTVLKRQSARVGWRKDVVDFLNDNVNDAAAASVRIVTLAPLTNVCAFAKRMRRRVLEKIDRIFVAAGALTVDGNVMVDATGQSSRFVRAPNASRSEVNVFMDPESAQWMLSTGGTTRMHNGNSINSDGSSGISNGNNDASNGSSDMNNGNNILPLVTLIPLDLAVNVTESVRDKLSARSGNAKCKMMLDLINAYKQSTGLPFYLHSTVATLIAMNPALCTSVQQKNISIVMEHVNMGQTVIMDPVTTGGTPVSVCMNLDRTGLLTLLYTLCSSN